MDALLAGIKSKKKDDEDEYVTEGTGGGGGGGAPTAGEPTTASDIPRSPVAMLPFYTGHLVERSETGFAGLSNQGATCYLNSLLQSLFMTPELRKAVFEWRLDPELHSEPKRCIPYQMQQLFARLQLSVRGSLSTKDLTTSFGWTGREMFVQHDVLELADVLFSFLETQAFGSSLSTVVSDMHRGEMEDYVKSLSCGTIRPKRVPFAGIGLDIAEARSFDDAMKRFITPEILTGGNQVNCDVCGGKRDAQKGIRFTKFPYFMNVYFRRWTLNWATLTRIKIQKKVPFPKEFDASVYLNSDGYLKEDGTIGGPKDDPTAAEAAAKKDSVDPQIYELYAIMMHSGGAAGGHYFAYIRDFVTDKWFEFNDARVEEIPPEAFAEFWKTPEEIEAEEAEKKRKQEERKKLAQKQREEFEAKKAKEAEDAAKAAESADGGGAAAAAAAASSADDASADAADSKAKSDPEDSKTAESSEEKKDSGVTVKAMDGVDMSGALMDALHKRQENMERFRDATLPADYVPLPKQVDVVGAVRPPKTYQNPMSGAYCLIYRLKDSERNVNDVDATKLVPSEIIDAIKAEDEKFKEQKAKLDIAMTQVNMVVHYKEDTVEQVICLKKDTVQQALEKIWMKMELKEKDGLDLDCVRLRRVKARKWTPKEPLTGDLASKTLIELGFKEIQHVALDSRLPDGDFPAFEPDLMSFKLKEYDSGMNEFKEGVMIQCIEEGTIRDLRIASAQSFGFLPTIKEELNVVSEEDQNAAISQVRLVFFNQGAAMMYSDDSALLRKDLHLKDGDIIHVEKCVNHLEDLDQSPMMRKFEEMVHFITIKYNGSLLSGAEYEEIAYDQSIVIDSRLPLMELRKKIAANYQSDAMINLDNLVLRRDYRGPELKDNDKTIVKHGLNLSLHVWCEKGSPLKATEYIFQIFVEDENYKRGMREIDELECLAMERNEHIDKRELKKRKDKLGEPFLLIGQVILDSQMEMSKVKEEIFNKFKDSGMCPPSAELIRLREFTSTRLTKVYLDTQLLGKNTGKQIRDFMQLCIQQTLTKERFTKGTILLNVARWIPSKLSFTPFEEMAFDKKAKIKTEFKDQLYAAVKPDDIIREDLLVCHPVPYMLKPVQDQRQKICFLDWDGVKLTDASTLGGKVWKCRNGDFVLYKSKSEKELFSKDDDPMAAAIAASLGRREEVPLTIYSPEEQRRREQEAAEKKAKDEAEAKERAEKAAAAVVAAKAVDSTDDGVVGETAEDGSSKVTEKPADGGKDETAEAEEGDQTTTEAK